MYLSLKIFDLRSVLRSLGRLGESRPGGRRVGHVDPDETILLFAGITAGVDAVDFQILIGGERGDQLALAVMSVELPAMVGALEIFSVKFAAMQRHAAVRAGVAQGERTALRGRAR